MCLHAQNPGYSTLLRPDLVLKTALLRFSPFDVVVVAQVVSLLLLLRVVQHHHRGVEVDDLSRGQQVEVGAAVTSAVAVPGARLS